MDTFVCGSACALLLGVLVCVLEFVWRGGGTVAETKRNGAMSRFFRGTLTLDRVLRRPRQGCCGPGGGCSEAKITIYSQTLANNLNSRISNYFASPGPLSPQLPLLLKLAGPAGSGAKYLQAQDSVRAPRPPDFDNVWLHVDDPSNNNFLINLYVLLAHIAIFQSPRLTLPLNWTCGPPSRSLSDAISPSAFSRSSSAKRSRSLSCSTSCRCGVALCKRILSASISW